ncbi:DUF4416 family protein [candidate division WOR-3 bacterium]|nr:DUF4416 family protein [candidate division WOR-3 bacterium]
MFERLKDEQQEFDPAKLVVGLLSADRKLLEQAQSALTEGFGTVTVKSPEVPFNFTDYYEKEMGPGLIRQWVSFHGLVEPDQLSDFKSTTRSLEKRFLGPNGKRRVNLDPGLLTLYNLVLASTKGYAHRIYLRDGIHAELTLLFHSGKFEPLPWTYPDYQTPVCQEFLMRCRKELLVDAAEQRTGHDGPVIKAS